MFWRALCTQYALSYGVTINTEMSYNPCINCRKNAQVHARMQPRDISISETCFPSINKRRCTPAASMVSFLCVNKAVLFPGQSYLDHIYKRNCGLFCTLITQYACLDSADLCDGECGEIFLDWTVCMKCTSLILRVMCFWTSGRFFLAKQKFL